MASQITKKVTVTTESSPAIAAKGKGTSGDKQGTIDTFLINHLECLPMCCADVRRETRSDCILSQVMEMVSTGLFSTTKTSDQSLLPYLVRRNELTLMQGCIMWGNRVIVPPKLRKKMLEELHTGHLGVVKMKAMARSYVWWPGLDAQIEEKCKTCVSCQRIQKTPSLTPLHAWPWPTTPWQRIHIDFAGPFEGHMFLVVMDAQKVARSGQKS